MSSSPNNCVFTKHTAAVKYQTLMISIQDPLRQHIVFNILVMDAIGIGATRSICNNTSHRADSSKLENI